MEMESAEETHENVSQVQRALNIASYPAVREIKLVYKRRVEVSIKPYRSGTVITHNGCSDPRKKGVQRISNMYGRTDVDFASWMRDALAYFDEVRLT